MNKREEGFSIPHFLSHQLDNDNENIINEESFDFMNELEKNTEGIRERGRGRGRGHGNEYGRGRGRGGSFLHNFIEHQELQKCRYNLKCKNLPNCKFFHDSNEEIIHEPKFDHESKFDHEPKFDHEQERRCNNGTRCPGRVNGCKFKHEPWPECMFGIDCKYNGDGCKKKHSKKILLTNITKDD
jgi:hypothetical protein